MREIRNHSLRQERHYPYHIRIIRNDPSLRWMHESGCDPNQEEISFRQTSGDSNWGLWPISGKRINVELGRWELYQNPISTGQMVSFSPQINRVLVVIFLISSGIKSSQTIPNSRNIASILPGYLENSHILSTSSSVTNEPSCTISIRVSLAIFLDHIRLIKNLIVNFSSVSLPMVVSPHFLEEPRLQLVALDCELC